MQNDHNRAVRGEVQGWSPGATRRNMAFLMGVEVEKLTGAGCTFTLTVRDCPATADDWHKLRRAFEKRMLRAGMIRMHWVTEWQRRGVPHLHGVLWFEGKCHDLAAIVNAWTAVAGTRGASPRGQHARPLDNAIGWFRYLSKHAVRGVKHYQRTIDNIPAGWQKKTGRVWGKVGDWPTREAIRVNLQNEHGDGWWFAFRRLCRAWRVADARAAGNVWRLKSARGMLRCGLDHNGGHAVSNVRGISEWIPPAVSEAFLLNLAERGYSVTC